MKKNAKNNVPKSATTKTPHPLADCEVWEVRTLDAPNTIGFVMGYLVTEPGNLDAPIAISVVHETCTNAELDALRRAWSVASDPFRIDCPTDGGAILDLRHRGRINSTVAMPGWLYGARLSPVVDDIVLDDTLIEYTPFCPVRVAVMLEQWARLTPAGQKTHPALRVKDPHSLAQFPAQDILDEIEKVKRKETADADAQQAA